MVLMYEFRENFSYMGPSCGDKPTLAKVGEVSINQVISANGARIPSFENSQKNFKVGRVVIVPKNQELDQDFVNYVDLYKYALPAAWEHATSYKSQIIY